MGAGGWGAIGRLIISKHSNTNGSAVSSVGDSDRLNSQGIG